jgi:lactoylglutathione lyase
MKYLWTTLRVADLDRSLKFYQEVVGLPVRHRLTQPGMTLVFLGEGETLVELIFDPKQTAVDLGQHVSLGFQVADLDATLADLKARGIEITGGPVQAGPRMRFFFVKDPDGLTVQFVEER